MTGPKHLWSGDWQQESDEPPVAPNRPPRPSAEVAAQRPSRRRSARLWRRTAVPLLALAVAIVIVLSAFGSGGPRHRPARHASSAASLFPRPGRPQTVPLVPVSPPNGLSGRTVNWLGMQISTVQNVGAVIQTVRLGSPADAAGLEPGDVLQTVNGRAIAAAGQIAPAVRSLTNGQAVTISVERGSTLLSAVAAIEGRPTTSP